MSVLILNQIYHLHKNNPILKTKNTEFYLIDEPCRKRLSNLFDCLGNISNYRDYYGFLKNYNEFSNFSKFHQSSSIKNPIFPRQAILILLDLESRTLLLPNEKYQKFFMQTYSKKFNIPIEHFYTNISYLPLQDSSIIMYDNHFTEYCEGVFKQEQEQKKEEEIKSESIINKFWKFFGWI